MSNVVIKSSDEFESVIISLEKSLVKMKDVFAREKSNIESINETDVWTGATQRVIYEKNLMLHKNFAPIEEATQIYINFLKKTIADYKMFEEKTNTNAENNSNQLNVNS